MVPKHEEEDDPITASYDVFITPALEQQLYLLQFPTRERTLPYNEAHRNQPLEMRIKPNSGFVEMDVPVSTQFCYNKPKAGVWGAALDQAKSEGASGYGIAAGFSSVAGLRGPGQRSRRQDEDKMDVDSRGMQHQTLGGQVVKSESGTPIYMAGAFRGDQLHLTKLDGIVQMRAQFHHIDAKSQVDRNKSRREREATEAPRNVEARQVQMAFKPLDNEQVEIGHTKSFLQVAQDESWTKLQFHDEDVGIIGPAIKVEADEAQGEEAFNAYHEKLFVQDTNRATQLISSMDNDQYIDTISASHDESGNRIKKPNSKKAPLEISDDSDEGDDVEEVDGGENAETQEANA